MNVHKEISIKYLEFIRFGNKHPKLFISRDKLYEFSRQNSTDFSISEEALKMKFEIPIEIVEGQNKIYFESESGEPVKTFHQLKIKK